MVWRSKPNPKTQKLHATVTRGVAI